MKKFSAVILCSVLLAFASLFTAVPCFAAEEASAVTSAVQETETAEAVTEGMGQLRIESEEDGPLIPPIAYVAAAVVIIIVVVKVRKKKKNEDKKDNSTEEIKK